MSDYPHFSDEHRMLREQVRRFVEREIRPHGEAWERDGVTPRELLRRMGALGFFGILFPESLGGSGLGPLGIVVLGEELGRSTFGGVSITALVHCVMASPHLLASNDEALVQRYLPRLLSGEAISAIAVTESDAGSDVAGIRTRAERDGDAWVLNGSKLYITNGCHGDVYFVAAKTDPRAKRSRGISMFLVERGTPGFRAARKLEKYGDLSSDTAELVFEDCRIPAERLIGEENKGFYAVMRNFQNERLSIGAMAVGEAETALRLTLEHVKSRTAFGAPLIDKQAIRQRLAMWDAKIEAARQLLYHAAWRASQGVDAVRETSMVKALCAEMVNGVMYDCQQFHGGMGYMRGTAIERMVRDARLHAIGGGATEVMLEEIAKRWS